MPNSDNTKTKTNISSKDDELTHLLAEIDHLKRELADRNRRVEALHAYEEPFLELVKAH